MIGLVVIVPVPFSYKWQAVLDSSRRYRRVRLTELLQRVDFEDTWPDEEDPLATLTDDLGDLY